MTRSLPPLPPLAELLFTWEEFLTIQKGQRPRGVAQYRKVVVSFFAWMGSNGLEADPAQVSRETIESWMKDLFYAGNIKNSSRASKLSALRSFFGWLRYADLLPWDCAKGIPSPKVQPVLPQKFSTEELRLIFAAPRKDTPYGIRDAAILKTMYAAGPRVSELIGLNIGDVIDSGGYIRLVIRGKGGKERTITLRRNPSKALREWILLRAQCSGDEALFQRLKGGTGRMSEKGFNNILKKYAGLVGIADADAFVHKMRATFITDLYDSGHDKCPKCGTAVRNFDVFEIMILAGHEDPKTTMGYTAIAERRLRKVAIPDARFNEIEGG